MYPNNYIRVKREVKMLWEHRKWRVFSSWRIHERFHGGSSIWSIVGFPTTVGKTRGIVMCRSEGWEEDRAASAQTKMNKLENVDYI